MMGGKWDWWRPAAVAAETSTDFVDRVPLRTFREMKSSEDLTDKGFCYSLNAKMREASIKNLAHDFQLLEKVVFL